MQFKRSIASKATAYVLREGKRGRFKVESSEPTSLRRSTYEYNSYARSYITTSRDDPTSIYLCIHISYFIILIILIMPFIVENQGSLSRRTR
jgi:hypothetical protein